MINFNHIVIEFFFKKKIITKYLNCLFIIVDISVVSFYMIVYSLSIYIYEIITFCNLLELIFQEIVKNEGANITNGNQRHNKYEKINKHKRLK